MRLSVPESHSQHSAWKPTPRAHIHPRAPIQLGAINHNSQEPKRLERALDTSSTRLLAGTNAPEAPKPATAATRSSDSSLTQGDRHPPAEPGLKKAVHFSPKAVASQQAPPIRVAANLQAPSWSWASTWLLTSPRFGALPLAWVSPHFGAPPLAWVSPDLGVPPLAWAPPRPQESTEAQASSMKAPEGCPHLLNAPTLPESSSEPGHRRLLGRQNAP